MSDCLFLLLKYVFSYMKESYFVACFIHSCVELWFVAEMIFGDCRWHQKDAQRIVVMSNSIKSILKLSWKFIQDKVRRPGLEKPVIYRVNFYKTCYLVYSCTNYQPSYGNRLFSKAFKFWVSLFLFCYQNIKCFKG